MAHTDWSARNVRLNDERLLAVYDWDSVALVPESTAVGQAAMTWSVTADPGGTEFPKAPDISGFIADYEEAAGYRLDDEQWRAGRGCRGSLYGSAYAARCELSLEATSGPDRTSTPPTTGWPKLPADGCCALRPDRSTRPGRGPAISPGREPGAAPASAAGPPAWASARPRSAPGAAASRSGR